jgi:hypothetical protein
LVLVICHNHERDYYKRLLRSYKSQMSLLCGSYTLQVRTATGVASHKAATVKVGQVWVPLRVLLEPQDVSNLHHYFNKHTRGKFGLTPQLICPANVPRPREVHPLSKHSVASRLRIDKPDVCPNGCIEGSGTTCYTSSCPNYCIAGEAWPLGSSRLSTLCSPATWCVPLGPCGGSASPSGGGRGPGAADGAGLGGGPAPQRCWQWSPPDTLSLWTPSQPHRLTSPPLAPPCACGSSRARSSPPQHSLFRPSTIACWTRRAPSGSLDRTRPRSLSRSQASTGAWLYPPSGTFDRAWTTNGIASLAAGGSNNKSDSILSFHTSSNRPSRADDSSPVFVRNSVLWARLGCPLNSADSGWLP